MDHSYRFFSNKDCAYYPCHEGVEELNCLFCYCPLYTLEACPGSPRYLQQGEKRIKDCSACTFPHRAEHYEAVIERLKG